MVRLHNQERLIDNLSKHAELFPGGEAGMCVKLIETHISFVFLVGTELVFKIKKKCNLGFLDFTDLKHRKKFCKRELELNSRFSPMIYKRVLAIAGNCDEPRFVDLESGDDSVFEYAVEMNQFDTEMQLDKLIQRGELTFETIEDLATLIARAHRNAPRSLTSDDSFCGSFECIKDTMIQNFTQIFEILENNPKLNDEFENHGEIESLHILHRWTLNQLDALKIEFEKRKLKGYIRECHGDLHLGNITVINNAVSLFDCIEFNDSFRIIDVMSEIAFLLMDLEDRNAPAFASHFLNVYLSETGDYEGLTLLTIYKAFRSLVRAKVHLMTCVSAHSHELVLSCMKNCHKYIELASNYLDVPRLNLVLLCGLSGSGKSYWGSKISREVGLIHLKSDVERKRLHNIEALQDSIKSGINIYDSETSCRTYARLAEIAELLMTSGFSVLIDATFLKLRYRQIFYELCKSKKPLNPKISLVHLNAPLELLKKRIVLRQQNLRRDPSEATIEVLLNQIKSFEKFQDEDLTNSELIEVSVTDHGLDFTDRTSSRNNSNCSTGILDTILQAMQ